MTVFFTTHYMAEAEKVADRIAIIDHGRIVATDSSAELENQTHTGSLEEAFIAITGTTIREEQANGTDRMRSIQKMWRRR